MAMHALFSQGSVLLTAALWRDTTYGVWEELMQRKSRRKQGFSVDRVLTPRSQPIWTAWFRRRGVKITESGLPPSNLCSCVRDAKHGPSQILHTRFFHASTRLSRGVWPQHHWLHAGLKNIGSCSTINQTASSKAWATLALYFCALNWRFLVILRL